jgi:hypothetical protein
LGALKIRVFLNGVALGSDNLDAEMFSVNPCKDAWIGDQILTGVTRYAYSGVVRDLAFSPYIWTPAQIAARAAL